MNPRGRQFGLAGALHSWVRRESFPPREAAVMRRCFSGREPRTFSRYGIRQWAAPLPSTRVVVKDPFALLSVAAIHEVTGALPVVLYRHPAAVLASYRRMGWAADTAELVALGEPPPQGGGDLEAMASMWNWCHEVVLSDLGHLPDSVLVSHQQLTAGGPAAWLALGRRLGMQIPVMREPTVEQGAAPHERQPKVLHDFARPRSDVESGWRRQLAPEEITAMEDRVADVWNELEKSQLSLPTVVGRADDLP